MAKIDYTNFDYYKLSDVNHDGVQYPGAIVQKNGAVYADQIIWGKVTIDGNEKDKATTEDVLTALEVAGSIDPSKIWGEFVLYYCEIVKKGDTEITPIKTSQQDTEDKAIELCKKYIDTSVDFDSNTIETYNVYVSNSPEIRKTETYTKPNMPCSIEGFDTITYSGTHIRDEYTAETGKAWAELHAADYVGVFNEIQVWFGNDRIYTIPVPDPTATPAE